MIELLSISYRIATREEIWSGKYPSLVQDAETAEQVRKKQDLKALQGNKVNMLQRFAAWF